MLFKRFRVEWGPRNDPKARPDLKRAEVRALLEELHETGEANIVLITSSGGRIEGYHAAASALNSVRFG